MKETMDSLQRQIDAAAVESRVWEQRLKELVALEQKLTELGILLRRDLPLETEEQKALSRLSGTEMDTETKISVFQKRERNGGDHGEDQKTGSQLSGLPAGD